MTGISRAHLVIRHMAADCIGCAACEETIPQYFRLDEHGMARLLDSTPEGVFQRALALKLDEADIDAAVEICPVDIIRVDAS
jgi:ferredoxin